MLVKGLDHVKSGGSKSQYVRSYSYVKLFFVNSCNIEIPGYIICKWVVVMICYTRWYFRYLTFDGNESKEAFNSRI